MCAIFSAFKPLMATLLSGHMLALSALQAFVSFPSMLRPWDRQCNNGIDSKGVKLNLTTRNIKLKNVNFKCSQWFTLFITITGYFMLYITCSKEIFFRVKPIAPESLLQSLFFH